MQLVLATVVVLLYACNSSASDKGATVATSEKEIIEEKSPTPSEEAKKPLVVPAAAPPAPADAKVPLRSDGLYATEVDTDDNTRSWLRFYEDGLVLSVATTGDSTAPDLAKWFAPSNKHISRGQVSRTGDTLAFSSKSPEGIVEYKGQITSDRIEFDTLSKITGHRDRRVYRFVAVAFPAQ